MKLLNILLLITPALASGFNIPADCKTYCTSTVLSEIQPCWDAFQKNDEWNGCQDVCKDWDKASQCARCAVDLGGMYLAAKKVCGK